MKKTIIILCTLMVLFLSGCESKEEKNQKYLEKTVDSVVINDFTSKDLELPSDINSVHVEWTSSNPTILATNGKITPDYEDTTVTLTANFSYEGLELQKTFTIVVEGVLKKAIASVVIPETTKQDLILPTIYEDIQITWESSRNEIISTKGVVNRRTNDCEVTLSATFHYGDKIFSKEYVCVVVALDDTEKIDSVIRDYEIAELVGVGESLDLETSFAYNIKGVWTSESPDIISNSGKVVNVPYKDTTCILNLELTSGSTKKQTRFFVVVKGLTDSERIDMAKNNIMVPKNITYSLYLPTTGVYGVTIAWKSSNTNVIDNTGVFTKPVTDTTIILTVCITSREETMNINYETNASSTKVINKKDHLLQVRDDLNEFLDTGCTNLVKNAKNQLVIKEEELTGTYVSQNFTIREASSLVASWSCITSLTSSAELYVRLMVDGEWGDYLSYGEWGLGKENKAVDAKSSSYKLSTDEVICNSGLYATALSFKIVLKRDQVSDASPILSLVSFALNLKNYSYPISNTLFNRNVSYDVPKLYQGAVPIIGGSICSATTTTMLLKYHGFDFSSDDSFEHRYIAGIVKDYGHNIYGNWTYNVVTMGAYGFHSYVDRMYSLDELQYSLLTNGPLGISVKGTMVSNLKTYTTNGHLIVLVGYKYVNNKLVFLANDPNVSSVLVEYSSEVIASTWRKITYVIE